MLIEPRTWQELFEAVLRINAARTRGDFAASVVAGMRRLIEADVTVFQVFDRARGRIITETSPPEPFTAEEVAYYTSHSDEFPLVPYYSQTSDPRARRVSDVVDLADWTQSAYYRHCLARQDLRYCLALPIAVDDETIVALSFNRRDPDFSLHDCELLDAFAPHVRLAFERHDDPWGDRRQGDAERRLQGLGLTPRESEVLFWMTEGKQNREIAAILGVRLGTVQDHVAAILAKLGQENRHAATVFAIGVLQAR
ncbi:LuxR C-terminal-related transcriptional regulator [Pseudoxanthobacter sp. M-2]|uniref:helix-turn-helix transcriptional regulator n=1 Tax=Pseudoxanthobacter sp. M-2 TaxID=3078754 RepID=UPI0038FCEB18